MNKSILLITTFLQVISANSLMAMEDDLSQTTNTTSQLQSFFPSQERGEKRKRESIKEEKTEDKKEEKRTKKLKTENDSANHNLSADEMEQDNRPDYLISPELNQMPDEIIGGILSLLKEDDKTLYSLLQVNKRFCSQLQPVFITKAKERGFIPLKSAKNYRGDSLSCYPERAGSRFYAAHDCLSRAWGALMNSALQLISLRKPSIVFNFDTITLISACDKGVGYLYPNSIGSRFLNYLTQLTYSGRFSFLSDNSSLANEILGDKLSHIASPPENIYEEGIPSWLVFSLLGIAPNWQQLSTSNLTSIETPVVKSILFKADYNHSFPTNLARMHLNSKNEWAKLENSTAPLEERLEILDRLLKHSPFRTASNLRLAAKVFKQAFENAITTEQKIKYLEQCRETLRLIIQKYGTTYDDARDILYLYEQASNHGPVVMNYPSVVMNYPFYLNIADILMKDPNKTLKDRCTAARIYKDCFFAESYRQKTHTLVKEIIEIASNNNNLDELRMVTSSIAMEISKISPEVYFGLGRLHDKILQHEGKTLQDMGLAAEHYCSPFSTLEASQQRSHIERGLKLADQLLQTGSTQLSHLRSFLLSRYQAFTSECFNKIERQSYVKEFIAIIEQYTALLSSTDTHEDLQFLRQIWHQCEGAYSATLEEEDKRKCIKEIISLSEFTLKNNYKELENHDQLAEQYEYVSYFYAKAGDKVSALNYLKIFLETDSDEFASYLEFYSDRFSVMDALWEGHESDPAYKQYLNWKNDRFDS